MRVRDWAPYVTDVAEKPPPLESPTIRIEFGPKPSVCDQVNVAQLEIQDALAVELKTIDVSAIERCLREQATASKPTETSA